MPGADQFVELDQTTTYTYDSQGRLLTTSRGKTTTTLAYSTSGNLTSVTDPLGRTTYYAYDPYGRLESVVDPMNGTTEDGYDLMSNLTSLTAAKRQTTSFEYDGYNRVKKVSVKCPDNVIASRVALIRQRSGSTTSRRRCELLRRGQRVASGTAAVVLSTAVACLPGVSRLRDENIRAEHGVALLEGYESYHTLVSDVDTDIVWFDYRLPQGVAVADTPAKIAKRITTRDSCYKIAESSADAVRLRCSDPAGAGFREYFVSIVPEKRLVFVMYAAIRGGVEQDAYERVINEFKAEVSARSQS